MRNIDTIEIKNKSEEAYLISKEKGEIATSKDFDFYNQFSNTHIQTALSSSLTSFNCHNTTVLTVSICNYGSNYISEPKLYRLIVGVLCYVTTVEQKSTCSSQSLLISLSAPGGTSEIGQKGTIVFEWNTSPVPPFATCKFSEASPSYCLLCC